MVYEEDVMFVNTTRGQGWVERAGEYIALRARVFGTCSRRCQRRDRAAW